MRQPWIDYETVVINRKNVDVFLADCTSGRFYSDKNTIVLYSFVVGDDLPHQLRTQVASVVRSLNADRDYALAHEIKHWDNLNAIGDIAEITRGNYYQEIYLNCLDELSAFTASVLRTSPELMSRGVTPETVAISMKLGVQEFVYGNGYLFYLDSLSQQLAENVFVDLRNQDMTIKRMRRQRDLYRMSPDKLFDVRFHRMAQQMFTFDNYCILRDASLNAHVDKIMNDTYKNIAQIKSRYLSRATDVLENFITPQCCRRK